MMELREEEPIITVVLFIYYPKECAMKEVEEDYHPIKIAIVSRLYRTLDAHRSIGSFGEPLFCVPCAGSA